MIYREHGVPQPLQAIVERIWTLEGDAPGEAQPVLPDGRPELIFHFGDPFERLDDQGRGERQGALLVCGQLDRALHLRPVGRTAVLGVRLRGAGIAALTRLPQDQLVNRTIEAGDVSRMLAGVMGQVRDRAESLSDAVTLIGRTLPEIADPSRIDPRVHYAVAVLEQRRASIGRLAADLGLTRRHLERLFREQVGLTPAQLARVHRFQRALAYLENGAETPRPGADAAAASGYADQAHFVRDFRALAGYTPSAHLVAKAELTGLLISRDRRGDDLY
ncbi:MAG TPA: helix-turn-helix domain-containing protein [Vicinamibacterales bacterium]|nr:helix-turn-helix domain-containing protein [Vicinamibacterales bacterium]